MPKSVRKLAGFTLIELLIVIAVIGILAVAVLSAINPIEQIKKGRDTSKKADAAELLHAAERYYTTFEVSPWPTNSRPSQTPMASNNVGILELIAKSELKSQFADRTYLPKLYVTEDATTGLVNVCFEPESVAFRAKAKKTITGAPNTACTTAWQTGCHICVPE